MNWPLVSRRAFDLALEERERLLAQADRLLDLVETQQDHVRRLERVNAGVSETVRLPRQQPNDMPKEVFEYLQGIGNPSIRREVRSNMYRKVWSGGTTWDEVVGEIKEEKMGVSKNGR